MSTTITPDMVREAYKVARRVYAQEVTRHAGIDDLVKRVKYNPSSAADAIDNYRCMRNGDGYERKNNLFTVRHYLEMIHRDDGLQALSQALDAVEKHLDYYDGVSTGGPQPGQRKLLEEFRSLVEQGVQVRGPDGLTTGQRVALSQVHTELQVQGVFDPANLEDGRKRTLASIVRRQGQSQFRTQLLALYEGRCAVSGCAVDAVLEAAHIIPYLGPKTDHPTNGLILRADIHTLFDLGLIAVDSKAMTVLVSPALDGTEYESHRGKALQLPAMKQGRPSPSALDRHRKESGL